MQINQMRPVPEMGTLGNHVLQLAQGGSVALHISAKGLWPNFNVTKRILSQAEGERWQLVVFQETLNKLLSKAASGKTREPWTPVLAVGAVYVFEESLSEKLKQRQEEEAEAVVYLRLGNFHGFGLQSHVSFQCLHLLPTACPSAHLPWMREEEVSVICSSHGVAASTLTFLFKNLSSGENLKTQQKET